mgnify:CR=1 FL=1
MVRRRDRDRYEVRADVPEGEDQPLFGPTRPDLDRGVRGGSSIGEAGSYGPRSDMMEYGGYEAGAYGHDEIDSDYHYAYNLYARHDDREDEKEVSSEPHYPVVRRHRFSLFRWTIRR